MPPAGPRTGGRRRERRMLTMLKRHEVEILLKAGHTKAEVARLTGVSLCSVKRIAQEGPVVHIDDARERAQRQVGRPSRVANFRKRILEILQQEPDLASLEILSGERGRPAMRAAKPHCTRW
jgi:transposase